MRLNILYCYRYCIFGKYRLKKTYFFFQETKLCICYVRICGSFKSAKNNWVDRSQIAKNIWSANRKSAKCRICGRSANLKKNYSPQICRFAICGTYLRTAQLCIKFIYIINKDLGGCRPTTCMEAKGFRYSLNSFIREVLTVASTG